MAMLFYFGFVDMSEISKIFEENYKFSVNHEILHDFYLKKILEHNKETKLEDAIYRDLRIGFRVFNNEKYVLITSKKNIDTAILILPKKDKETEFFSAEIDDKFNIVKIIRELEIKNGKQLFEHLEEIKHFQQFKRIQETSGFLNSAMASRIEEKPQKVKSD